MKTLFICLSSCFWHGDNVNFILTISPPVFEKKEEVACQRQHL